MTDLILEGVPLEITGGFPMKPEWAAQTYPIVHARPPGVHVLSPESQAVLARAAEKGAAITARHTKRGS